MELVLDAVRLRTQVCCRVGELLATVGAHRAGWRCLMTTELQLVILSIVSLSGAALIGGGIGLGVMRLFGYKPPRAT